MQSLFDHSFFGPLTVSIVSDQYDPRRENMVYSGTMDIGDPRPTEIVIEICQRPKEPAKPILGYYSDSELEQKLEDVAEHHNKFINGEFERRVEGLDYILSMITEETKEGWLEEWKMKTFPPTAELAESFGQIKRITYRSVGKWMHLTIIYDKALDSLNAGMKLRGIATKIHGGELLFDKEPHVDLKPTAPLPKTIEHATFGTMTISLSEISRPRIHLDGKVDVGYDHPVDVFIGCAIDSNLEDVLNRAEEFHLRCMGCEESIVRKATQTMIADMDESEIEYHLNYTDHDQLDIDGVTQKFIDSGISRLTYHMDGDEATINYEGYTEYLDAAFVVSLNLSLSMVNGFLKN